MPLSTFAQAEAFASRILELLELDRHLKVNTFRYNYQPTIPFREIKEDSFLCAFFRLADWLDCSKREPLLWVGHEVGYGTMLLIPWEVWQKLRYQLDEDMKKLSDHLFELYCSDNHISTISV